MDKTITERRVFPRIVATLPIRITPEFLGQTIDLSETGLRFVLEKPLLLSKAYARIELSPEDFIETEFKVIWNKHLVKENKFTYGACFIRLKEKDLEILREVIIQTQLKDILRKIDDLAMKSKISNFWHHDLKKYITEVAKLSRKINNEEISKDEAEKIFFLLTDEMMQKAEELEESISQRIIMKKAKQSFREIMGSWIYEGRVVKRAFEKPRGYPGDYKTLEEIYNNCPLSKGIGYCSDKYFLENEYAVAVRNRKDKMKEILVNFIQHSDSSIIKILNLACGSCREIRELFVENKFITDKKIVFTLIDQDEEALEFAKNLFNNLPSNIKFNFLKDDILNLIKTENILSGRYNLIYSIGLADYLPDRALKRLIQLSIKLLDSKGKFIITHKDIERCHPVAPDWFCDWNFYSRNEKYLVDLVKSIGVKNFDIETIREESRRILFLVIANQL
ncbi:MAG: DUF1796 family putative cysteine peptidase [Candidatus Omnitrophica bacterium]|nr:DUF1796 family putative cysteine peptidase [Candidatus Omnitrophota bacterium]